MAKRLVKIFLSIITGYLVLVTGIYLFQDKLVFQADKLEKDYSFEFSEDFIEITIIPTQDQEINALIFSIDNARLKGTVLYFHGNADNMQRWGEYAVDFTSQGYAVLMIDYSGYGKSSGIPSEETLYRNAEETWLWAQHHLPSTDFIIYGRSLGTAVASHLATNYKAKQLILETPFYQLNQARLSWLFPFGLKYKFPNYQYLQNVASPITILQGDQDRIVSYESAAKLKEFLKPGDNFILIKGGKHKNLRDFKNYHLELSKTLK